MSSRTALQIILGTAFVVAIGTVVLRHAKPLVPAPNLEVIYTAGGEDFRTDGRAYRPFYRRNMYYIYLPKAGQNERWWAVNVASLMVYRPREPGRIGALRYVRWTDMPLIPLSDETVFSGWQWQFTQDGLSFAGEGLTCIITRR